MEGKKEVDERRGQIQVKDETKYFDQCPTQESNNIPTNCTNSRINTYLTLSVMGPKARLKGKSESTCQIPALYSCTKKALFILRLLVRRHWTVKGSLLKLFLFSFSWSSFKAFSRKVRLPFLHPPPPKYLSYTSEQKEICSR